MTSKRANSLLIDIRRLDDWPLWDRMIGRMFRRVLNKFAKQIIGAAFERGHIDSFTMHEMMDTCDVSLWPERYRTQREEAVQLKRMEA